MKTLLITGGAIERNLDGQFIRIRKHWTLGNFEDGYINCGRFKVYVPEHPRANSEGYVLRAIVAYEAYHGDIVTRDFAIHHKNGNKLDDSENNLEKKAFGEHSRDHNLLPKIKLICATCGKEFTRDRYKINEKLKLGCERIYCSRYCFAKRGQDTAEVKQRKADAISNSWCNSEIRAKRIAGMKLASGEGRQQQSKIMKEYWLDPQKREKWVVSMKGRTEEERQRMSDATRMNWLDPDIKARRIEGMKLRKAMRRTIL